MTNPLNRIPRAAPLAAATLALVLLLASCGGQVGPRTLRVTLGETSEIGYEITPQGIVVTTRTFTMRNAPGAHGVNITGYTARYYDENGAPLAGGAGQETSLAIFVPPGIDCDQPDPTHGCTLRDAGAYYAEGPVASLGVTGNQLMPLEIINAHINAGQPAGWHALITFTGRDNFNAEFTTVPYRFDVAPPN